MCATRSLTTSGPTAAPAGGGASERSPGEGEGGEDEEEVGEVVEKRVETESTRSFNTERIPENGEKRKREDEEVEEEIKTGRAKENLVYSHFYFIYIYDMNFLIFLLIKKLKIKNLTNQNKINCYYNLNPGISCLFI